jgi:NAD dependent epimerase/dehydratase family enzyme
MVIKSVCPMSQVLIKMIFGEMSKIVLTEERISSDKLEETGFQTPYLEDTLGTVYLNNLPST